MVGYQFKSDSDEGWQDIELTPSGKYSEAVRQLLEQFDEVSLRWVTVTISYRKVVK